MPKNLLIRKLDDATARWIESATPVGVSKNEFVRRVIRKAAESEGQQLSIFEKGHRAPKARGRKPRFRFVDLFAGIGGFRIGLDAVGGQCVFTNDWDKNALRTYTEWFGSEHVVFGDIRSPSVLQAIPDHDILCGGFPCQPFSLAGVSKKNSMGRTHGFADEDQGNLFFAVLEVIDRKRPKVVFLENVKNLRSHDKGNTWRTIIGELERRNYVVFDQTIDAQHWVPQHRERIFIVCFDKKIFGSKSEVKFTFPPLSKLRAPKLGSILDPRPDSKYMLSDKLWAYLRAYRAKHEKAGNGFGYSLFGPTDSTRTLSARYHKDGSEILVRQPHWRNPRRLTPREALLLMGFKDTYAKVYGHTGGFPICVSDTQAYRQAGNAVVPLAVEAVAKEIVATLARRRRRTA
jgi:DNA (cytosine-5)-methyltransferase 1